MNRFLRIAPVLLAACCFPLIAGTITYTYTGNPFPENAFGFTQVTASFTLDHKLDGENLVICPTEGCSGGVTDTSAWLVSWTMSDGVDTLSSAAGSELYDPWLVGIVLGVDSGADLPSIWRLIATDESVDRLVMTDNAWQRLDGAFNATGSVELDRNPGVWTVSTNAEVPEPAGAGLAFLGLIAILSGRSIAKRRRAAISA
jgi:hypothetical protein